MLAWTIYISFLGVLVLMLLPKSNAALARGVALLTALIGLGIGIAGLVQYSSTNTAQGWERIVEVASPDCIPSLGIHYHLAADGISITLVLLTGLAAVAGILWGVKYTRVDPLMGLMPGIKAFIAAVFGGIGNIAGAVLGAVVLGLIEVMVVGYLPGELSLDPSLTGGQILQYFGHLRGGIDQAYLKQLIARLDFERAPRGGNRFR